MTEHVVLGKGQIGSTVARILAERGERVRVLSRSGGESAPGITHAAVDARNAEALIAATASAEVIYNCANPAGYHRWADEWPPMFAAILAAARVHGASLVNAGNLYVYGQVDAPMTERTPLRSQGPKGQIRIDMWTEAMTLHDKGDIRFTEARGSDYFGPGALADAMLGERIVRSVIDGGSVAALGDTEAPHSFTYIPDVARALVRLGGDDRAWGRPWHVPTAPARSQREMIETLSRLLGYDEPVRIRRLPWWVLIRVIGMFEPAMRGMTETRHQWDGPYVMESSDFTATFGDEPTATETALAETLEWWRRRLART